jgi:hypothetical protein
MREAAANRSQSRVAPRPSPRLRGSLNCRQPSLCARVHPFRLRWNVTDVASKYGFGLDVEQAEGRSPLKPVAPVSGLNQLPKKIAMDIQVILVHLKRVEAPANPVAQHVHASFLQTL